jgi:hemerythrin
MPFMVWNDRLSVGVAALDADHKKMVEIINELYDAILAGSGREKLDGLLDRLMDYARYHFVREEELFAKTEYPDAAAHKREHEEMAAWINTTCKLHRGSTIPAPSLEVMIRLKDYFFDHILSSDQKYVPHIKAHNIR